MYVCMYICVCLSRPATPPGPFLASRQPPAEGPHRGAAPATYFIIIIISSSSTSTSSTSSTSTSTSTSNTSILTV